MEVRARSSNGNAESGRDDSRCIACKGLEAFRMKLTLALTLIWGAVICLSALKAFGRSPYSHNNGHTRRASRNDWSARLVSLAAGISRPQNRQSDKHRTIKPGWITLPRPGSLVGTLRRIA